MKNFLFATLLLFAAVCVCGAIWDVYLKPKNSHVDREHQVVLSPKNCVVLGIQHGSSHFFVTYRDTISKVTISKVYDYEHYGPREEDIIIK